MYTFNGFRSPLCLTGELFTDERSVQFTFLPPLVGCLEQEASPQHALHFLRGSQEGMKWIAKDVSWVTNILDDIR